MEISAEMHADSTGAGGQHSSTALLEAVDKLRALRSQTAHAEQLLTDAVDAQGLSGDNLALMQTSLSAAYGDAMGQLDAIAQKQGAEEGASVEPAVQQEDHSVETDTQHRQDDGLMFSLIHRASSAVPSDQPSNSTLQQSTAASTTDGKHSGVRVEDANTSAGERNTGDPVSRIFDQLGGLDWEVPDCQRRPGGPPLSRLQQLRLQLAAGGVGAGLSGSQHGGAGNTAAKEYGRPCLAGLPPGVMGHMGSFLTTIDATRRLTHLSREIHGKATDETFGIYRTLVVTEDEYDTYDKLEEEACDDTHIKWLFSETTSPSQRLGNIHAAHVRAPSVSVAVAKVLEAASDTLAELHVSGGWMAFQQDGGGKFSPRQRITFPKLAHMSIRSKAWFHHVGNRWNLPSLRSLRSVDFPFPSTAVVRVLETAPEIQQLEAAPIIFTDQEWADFPVALGKCPHITSITGLKIDFDDVGRRANQLKDALEPHWARPWRASVRKKLGFVVPRLSIGARRWEGGATTETFRWWAVAVGCHLEWRTRDNSMTIDCSSADGVSAPVLTAPDKLYGQIAAQLAAKATEVELKLGGRPVHKLVGDMLVFAHAKTLTVRVKHGVSAAAVVESIPTWLPALPGRQQPIRRFPSIERLIIWLPSLPTTDLRGFPSALSGLTGTLTSVKSVWFRGACSLALACEVLCFLPVRQLDEVTFSTPPTSHGFPGSVPPMWSRGIAQIKHIEVQRGERGGLGGDMACCRKADLLALIECAMAARPSQLTIDEVLVSADELKGEDRAAKLSDLRSFAWGCCERVRAHYTMTESKSALSQEGEFLQLSLTLVAK